MCAYSVDIVIPQYKNIALLRRNLESIRFGILPPSLSSIIVVENGGAHGAEDVVREFKEYLPIKYEYISEGNLSNARNHGVHASSADVIIFFDNDIVVARETIVSYCNAFLEYGTECFYGGPLEADYERAPSAYLLDYLPYSAKGFSLGEEDLVQEIPYFLGGNHAVFREDILAVGGYDKNCAIGINSGALGEETRLQEKLLHLNRKAVYVAGAVVKHWVPRENCSPSWVLKRALRAGWTDALAANLRPDKDRLMLSVPYFEWRYLFVAIMKLPVSLLTFNPEKIFGSLHGIFRRLGSFSYYREMSLKR